MILSFATDNFSDWVDLLLRSYQGSNPGKGAKIYCLGWGDGLLAEFRDKYPTFRFEWFPLSVTIREKVEKTNEVQEVLKLKLPFILHEIITTTEPFIWVDADTLVMRDIGPFLDKLSEYDFMATHRPAEYFYPWGKFMAGVLGFGRSTQAIKFLSRASIRTQIINDWFSEQIALSQLYADAGVKLYHLSEDQHSINGYLKATFISRKGKVDKEMMLKIVEEREKHGYYP
jgi:hypothetical protein